MSAFEAGASASLCCAKLTDAKSKNAKSASAERFIRSSKLSLIVSRRLQLRQRDLPRKLYCMAKHAPPNRRSTARGREIRGVSRARRGSVNVASGLIESAKVERGSSIVLKPGGARSAASKLAAM